MRLDGRLGDRIDPTFLLGVHGVTELVLVRHARQDLGDDFLDHAIGELHDPPLSDLGRRQAEAVARSLAGDELHAVYASHLQRAADTAKSIAAEHGLDVGLVDGIEEFGLLRDLPAEQTARQALGEVRFRGLQRRWSRTRRWSAWPASEPVGEFYQRVIGAIEGLVAGHTGQRVAVVTHGGVLNAYVGDLLGSTDDMFFSPAHASITRVRAKHDRRVLMTLNEIQHLAEPDDLLTF
jgi:probable phosphoglycerate mutase